MIANACSGKFPDLSFEGHRPFTISSLFSYFIGFTDLIPDKIGYHDPGEMGGLWYHPIRLIRNIFIDVDGKIVKAESCRLLPYSALFQFPSFSLCLSIEEDGTFHAFIEGNPPKKARLVLELMPRPVWNSIDTFYYQYNDDSIDVMSNAFPWIHINLHFKNGYNLLRSDLIATSGSDLVLTISSKFCNENSLTKSLIPKLALEGSTELNSEDELTLERFNSAKANIIQLTKYVEGVGYGLTAGHPDFPWFFGIDTLLSVKGLLFAGLDEIAYGSLNLMSRFSFSGRVPHEIITSGKIYNQGDLEETALFPFAVYRYLVYTSKIGESTHLLSTAKQSFQYIFDHGLAGRGIMEDAEAGTGIDLDTVVFLYMSLKELEQLYSFYKDNEIILDTLDWSKHNLSMRQLKRLIDAFWIDERNTYANRIVNGFPKDNKFWTSILPFYAGIGDREHFENFISSTGGLHNISRNGEITVDAMNNSMPINTGMFVISALNYGKTEIARQFFYSLEKSYSKFSPNSFPEISNNPNGCYLQAWSAAIYIEDLIGGFLGIAPEGDVLKLKPAIDPMVLKIHSVSLKFRGKKIKLTIDE
ncbi:TVG1202803 [Thermoplasma volcanium GSS1]|uniref:TVG1202803 protein n=1 Tax=Thermoplasma volcanium (strain ATCC 51530 / DSM 4299 / JCM 9571 / NBRC 15438 / GSS1) TaxID=273116 RepID=Q979I8_THEVO|nr:amylo-alpha-1,6-glucosidase [Thermoplasma volcanium]BAB60315.1 TVG1202803 [Thermoplasma volcanium GSS1]